MNRLPKHIIDNIFQYDNTYREIYSKCMKDIKNLEPSIIYGFTPCMYRVKRTKPFYGEVKIFDNTKKVIMFQY
jgi:hypothetical protein